MRTLKADRLKKMLDEQKDLTLINVLSEEDFRRVHIPGSENIPVDRNDFVQRVERLAGGKDATVIVYCADADCSASPKAAKKLEEAGFKNVFDFEGGVAEWRKAGHEVERQTEAKTTA